MLVQCVNYLFIGTSLVSVTLPPNIKTIGANAFYGCVELTSILIPNTTTEIGVQVVARQILILFL